LTVPIPNRQDMPEGLNEQLVRAVVDRFYALARKDEIIGPIFLVAVPDERWHAHLDTITDFWSSLLLGTGRYNGRPLPKHAAIAEISDAHFRRWLALFRLTAEEICPPQIARLFIERSETIGNSFRMNIRMRRGEDLIHLKPLERETIDNRVGGSALNGAPKGR